MTKESEARQWKQRKQNARGTRVTTRGLLLLAQHSRRRHRPFLLFLIAVPTFLHYLYHSFGYKSQIKQ